MEYKSVSLNKYVYGLLHKVGAHMREPWKAESKPYSIPIIITILAENYQTDNIIIPKQFEKEVKNEI
tara:strand:- start:33 stop:233 length:201 start_codon:yes stop_codon:yes gene_type:complete